MRRAGIVPDRIIDKPKIGFFNAAVGAWFRAQADGAISDYLLAPRPAIRASLLERDEVAGSSPSTGGGARRHRACPALGPDARGLAVRRSCRARSAPAEPAADADRGRRDEPADLRARHAGEGRGREPAAARRVASTSRRVLPVSLGDRRQRLRPTGRPRSRPGSRQQHGWISTLHVPGDADGARRARRARFQRRPRVAARATCRTSSSSSTPTSRSSPTTSSGCSPRSRATRGSGSRAACATSSRTASGRAKHVTGDHVRGATRAYRRDCLEQVGAAAGGGRLGRRRRAQGERARVGGRRASAISPSATIAAWASATARRRSAGSPRAGARTTWATASATWSCARSGGRCGTAIRAAFAMLVGLCRRRSRARGRGTTDEDVRAYLRRQQSVRAPAAAHARVVRAAGSNGACSRRRHRLVQQRPRAAALRRAAGATRRGATSIVVDNESSDGSLDDDRGSAGPERSPRAETSASRPAATSAGARASSPYVLFLNPDARDRRRRRCGGSSTCSRAARGGHRRAADRRRGRRGCSYSLRRFPRLRSTYAQALFLAPRLRRSAPWADEIDPRPRRQYERPAPQEWVSGACMLVRRETLERLGGWDEGFFLYCEDIDLCRRVHDLGLEVHYEPGATVTHPGGRLRIPIVDAAAACQKPCPVRAASPGDGRCVCRTPGHRAGGRNASRRSGRRAPGGRRAR